MTLFANSGVGWPDLELQTKNAGRQYLESVSILFSVLSKIEGGEAFVDEQDLYRCSQILESTSKEYLQISEFFSPPNVEPLSSSEMELAAVEYYDANYRYGNVGIFYELFFQRSQISMSKLYLELSERVGRLSSAARH